MEYEKFSQAMLETFKLERLSDLTESISMVNELKFEDVMLVKKWFEAYISQYIELFGSKEIYLRNEVLKGKSLSLQTELLYIQTEKKIKHHMEPAYFILYCGLLNDNRIMLIYKSKDDYRIDIYELLSIQNQRDIRFIVNCVKYNLAYKEYPFKFANEIKKYRVNI